MIGWTVDREVMTTGGNEDESVRIARPRGDTSSTYGVENLMVYTEWEQALRGRFDWHTDRTAALTDSPRDSLRVVPTCSTWLNEMMLAMS
jgi:hypothetical protein